MQALYKTLDCPCRWALSAQSWFLAHARSGSMPSAERGDSAPQRAPLAQKAWMRGPAQLSVRGFLITLGSDPSATHGSRIADGD